MSDPAAVAAPSPNPNPAPSPPPPPRLREEGELSSGADDDEALGTNLTFASNVGKSSEVVQVPSTTFSGKGTSGLSLPNVRPHKSAAPSYRKNLRMKQVQFKVSTKRSRCWQKPVSSDNLVISFSDDDSGSDSGKSKREDSRDRGGSSQDASKMASNMQTKMVREETPQQMTQVAKLGYANCSTIPLTLGNSGASRGSGATMSRREPSIRHSTPVKAPSSQKDRNSEDVNSAVSNLRHEIAIRENELRVQKRSTSLGFAKDADLSTYRSRSPIEKLSSETPNSGGCSPLNGSLGPDSRSTKRLKPEQQCSNNQVPGGHLAALVPTNISMGKNNVQFTERRACFENGGNMNCNISGTELSNQIEHNAATRNLPASETHHRVTQDTGRRAAVEYSDKFAAVEYNGKHSIAEDSSTLVPVTLVQAVPDVGTSSKKVMDGMFSACDRQQNTDLLNCSGQMGTGEGRTTLLSLLEMEELQEKDLEEAQEHRRRCEVEEKEALRAYRKAQRALIEANERCAILRRKRELFSARLHGFIAENPSSAWPSSIPNAGVTHVMPSVPNSEVPADCQMPENLGGNSNIPYPDEAAQQPIDKHESQAHHNGELVASTADPKFVSTANDTRGAANLSIIPSAYMEDDLHFPAKRPRSECLSNLENHMEETIHVDVEENRQTSRDSALDYELLEASLRSRLVDRFGKKPPLNNAEESSVELAIAKVTGTEHNKSPTYVGTQSQEAEANFPTSTEGTMELEGEDADLAEKICGQSNSSNGLSVDNRDMTTDPEDSMSLFRESCMSYAILPSSAPQNAARQMKRVLPGFCKEALDHQSGRLTSDAASEAAISAPDMLQDHPKENTKVLSRTNAKDNDMLDCGIDPFWPFCMFELRGRCNDEECQWQHVERCTWRKSEHSKHAIASVSGRIPYGLFKHILPVPTYRIGSNLIRADLNLVQSVLASSIWQYWQRGFCASFPLPLSVQRVLPSDAPFLQAGDGSIADFDRNRLLFNFQRPDGRKSKIGQGSIDAEQLLEAALDLYCGKVNKPDRIKALLLLARAIEADPSTVILWVFYLHIYYQKDEGLGKDDMFSQAVQHNVYSYELWVMYINSRLRFDDRLDAYNDALSMLCQMTADTDKELKDKSTFILDIFLRMIYFLCMSGNVKKAISRIFGIMATPDYSGDKLLTDVVSCLTVYDKCIFWVSCIYVLIYRKLPEEIAGQLELQKDLPHELIWPAIELRVDDRGQLVELLKYAVDKMALDINEVMKNGDPSYLRLSHFLAVSHINCLAALEGFQCSADLLVKYMKDYPTCPEILLISARLDKKYDTCPDLRGFDELILNWPKEVQGIQYLWNQYFEHALADNIDLAKKLLTRWFEEYGKDGLLQSSAAVCVEVRKDKSEYPSLASPQELSSSSSRSEDQVFWFLNLSLYRMLQNNMQEAQVAVDEALKLARGKSYEHCLREHAAIHIWDKSSSSTDFHSQDIFSLVSGYLADRWNLPMRELLSRRFCQNVKKHRVRQLMDDTLGPASADSYLINSILEVCYGPALLPDIIEVKHLVEFVESVMEVLPANYHLALAVGRFVVGHYAGADPASKGLRFWASSVLVNAIFRAVPVAPESVWLEGAHLLDKLQAMEIMNRFHQQATSVYPFSFRLWHAYLIAGKVTGSNTKSIVEAARQRGIELNPTPP